MAKDVMITSKLHTMGGQRRDMPTKPSMLKAKVSDRLQEDAQVMEARLMQLRLKMLEDKKKLERDLPAKFGGSRWRSAQEGLGSVSRYAKDVEHKMKNSTSKVKKGSGNGRGKSAGKTLSRGDCDVTSVPMSEANVYKWSTKQVLDWLKSIGLEEFESTFEFHQISGRALLAMEIVELEEIGIHPLSARNKMWTELDRIKGALLHRGGAEMAGIVDPALRNTPVVPEVEELDSDTTVAVHWSHIKPLRESGVTSGEEVPVNLADGEFNEDASHASFLKALLDWRAGDVDTAHTHEENDGLWFNPANSDTVASSKDSVIEKGGALLFGEYDEAKEQEAFQLAVLAWRNGDSNPPDHPKVKDQTEHGSSTEPQRSCWHCYRVSSSETYVEDPETLRWFCGDKCRNLFHDEYVQLYQRHKNR